MQQRITPQEAVRLAQESLAGATAAELATHIQERFGLAIKAPIVTVLLGSMQERAELDRTGAAAYQQIQRWKDENPEEAKKLAAATRKREAARKKKAARQPGAAPTREGSPTADPPDLSEGNAPC